ncbi:hypothetical protein JXB31_00805 [Candidatus Woesearchaeota archaeon]|nr:hypothetical protein [Candidatus Woesearchaeota archaeon]
MRRPISATIDERLIRWINSELKDGMKYRNKSHLIEIALMNLKESKDQNNDN